MVYTPKIIHGLENMIVKTLNIHERERVRGVMDGKYDPNSKVSQNILTRPHVAIALETILDNADLTDEKIAERVKDVLTRRKESKFDKSGNETSNQTTVDNNALQAARMLWQAKGKFVERHEVGKKGDFADLPDEQIDNMIEQGQNMIKDRIQGASSD